MRSRRVGSTCKFKSHSLDRFRDGQNEGLRKRLRHILQAGVHEEANSDGTKADGLVTLQIGDARIAFLILESSAKAAAILVLEPA